jgi:hypothetical protein
MLRVLISAVLVIVLAACQSKPVDPEQVRANMLRELGIDPSTVVHQDQARYAIGSGAARPTAFKSGLYVQTATELHLLRNKDDGKALERDLSFPLAQLQYATLETWSFTHLKQLQLGSPSGMVVVNFHNTPDAMAGDGDRADSAYAALQKANVRSGAASGRIWPEQAVKPYSEVYPVTVK